MIGNWVRAALSFLRQAFYIGSEDRAVLQTDRPTASRAVGVLVGTTA